MNRNTVIAIAFGLGVLAYAFVLGAAWNAGAQLGVWAMAQAIINHHH